MSSERFFINGKLAGRDRFMAYKKHSDKFERMDISVSDNGDYHMKIIPISTGRTVICSTPRQNGKSSFYHRMMESSDQILRGLPYGSGWSNFQEEYQMQFYNRGELYYSGGILRC